MVKPLGAGCDNEVVSEVAAFCVHPDYRGSGRGDSLLAYLGTSSSSASMLACLLSCPCFKFVLYPTAPWVHDHPLHVQQ